MPVYLLKCTSCKFTDRKILDRFESYECPYCHKGLMVRNPQMNVQIKESVDNGLMPKKVEVYKDIKELVHERNKNKG